MLCHNWVQANHNTIEFSLTEHTHYTLQSHRWMREECRPSFLRLLFNTLFHTYTPRHPDVPVMVSAFAQSSIFRRRAFLVCMAHTSVHIHL